MKKHKIKALAKYAGMYDEVTITGKDEERIVVRTHIPYEKKLEFAREYVEQAMMVHEDSCYYCDYQDVGTMMLLVCKYYTDINTDGVSVEQIMDFLVNDELINKLCDTIETDLCVAKELAYGMLDAAGITYDDDHSLKQAVKTSFGFLFTGEDITESLAKAETTRDTLFNALDALREREAADAAKIGGGTANIAGNLIQFKRKDE